MESREMYIKSTAKETPAEIEKIIKKSAHNTEAVYPEVDPSVLNAEHGDDVFSKYLVQKFGSSNIDTILTSIESQLRLIEAKLVVGLGSKTDSEITDLQAQNEFTSQYHKENSDDKELKEVSERIQMLLNAQTPLLTPEQETLLLNEKNKLEDLLDKVKSITRDSDLN